MTERKKDRIKESRRLIRQAQEEFDAGDPLQAGEKAWGAVVHRTKAIADDRGKELNNHVEVMKAAEEVALHTDDPDEALENLTKAKALHINFYDNDLNVGVVERGIAEARGLLDSMDRVAPSLPEDLFRRTPKPKQQPPKSKKKRRKSRRSPQMKRVEELKRKSASETRKSRSLQGDPPVMTQAQFDRMRP